MSAKAKGKVVIALAGHTNSGKTTLIRTLTKSNFGQIDDSANTTKRAKVKKHEAVHAVFIDCPGFQHAKTLMLYLKSKDHLPKDDLEELENDLLYDRRALEGIAQADIVLYVASLEVAPDDAYGSEIQAIRTQTPNAIGVINQYGKHAKAQSLESADRRSSQWEDILRANGIEKIIRFDAHWDSPEKIAMIYQLIRDSLGSDKAENFSEGYSKFRERQNVVRAESCGLLASCIVDIWQKSATSESKTHGYSESKTQDDAKSSLTKSLKERVSKFSFDASSLFELAIQNPTLSPEELSLSIQSREQSNERLSNAAAGGAITASIGAAAAALLTIATGGLALPVVVAGGAAGGVGGALAGASADVNTVFSTSPSDSDLEYVARKCVAILWGLSHHGYGLAPKLTERQVDALNHHIESIDCPFPASKKNYFIKKAEGDYKKEVELWCTTMLEELEGKQHLSSV